MRVPFAFMKGAAPGYDPAVRALTSWHRASYSGSPWLPTASAGTSGTNGNQTGAAAPSAAAGALNGLQPADFDAALTQSLANTVAISSLVSNAAGSIACLINADLAAADGGSTVYYQAPALFTDSVDGFLALTFNAAGVRLGCYNGTNFDAVTQACSVAAPHLVMARWNATTIEVRVDSVAWTTMARTVQLSTSANRMGANYAEAAFYDGKIYERMTEQARWSDAEANDIKSYINARYALAL